MTNKSETLHDRPSRASAHADMLDRQMGLAPAGGGTRNEGHKLVLGGSAANYPKFKARFENVDTTEAKAEGSDETKPRPVAKMSAKEIIRALRAKAESDDEDADEARAALAEFNDEPDDDDDEPEDQAAVDVKAPVAGASSKVRMQAVVQRELKAIRESAARDQLIASRPDLSASVRKELSALSLASVERLLPGIPVVRSPAQNAIAGGLHIATVPKGSLTGTPGKPEASNLSAHGASLDQQMGLAAKKGSRIEGSKLILGGGS